MKHLTKIVLSLLIGVAVNGSVIAQEAAKDQFVSVVGRFGINLPPNYTDYKASIDINIAGQKYNGTIYRWNTKLGMFIVSYANGVSNIEDAGQSEAFLKTLRDDYLTKVPQGASILSEKQISLDSHPGTEFVVQLGDSRSINRAYVFKHRFYFLTLLPEGTQSEKEAMNIFSSFKFLTRNDIEAYNKPVIESLTTTSLPQEPILNRPATDAQDHGLKGKIKQVVVEREQYIGANLFGFRTLVSVNDYNEQGNLVKSVLYGNDLPFSVRVYGYMNGERVFRTLEKDYGVVLVTSDPKQKDTVMKSSKPPQPKIYKIKYKYNDAGQLTEMQVVQEGGKELEKFSYKIKDKKVEHNFTDFMGLIKFKTISSMDDSGNIVEETLFSPGVPETVYYRDADKNLQSDQKSTLKEEKFSYKYEFDEQGNWKKKTKFQVVKENGKLVEKPVEAIYRTVISY